MVGGMQAVHHGEGHCRWACKAALAAPPSRAPPHLCSPLRIAHRRRRQAHEREQVIAVACRLQLAQHCHPAQRDGQPAGRGRGGSAVSMQCRSGGEPCSCARPAAIHSRAAHAPAEEGRQLADQGQRRLVGGPR